jgi:hypothetical protein
MNIMKTQFGLLLAALLLCAAEGSVLAQGTAFTYQGRLDAGGQPANGSYDVQFTLYTMSLGGTAVAGPVIDSATAVIGGMFNAAVDFGPGVFTGVNYWLDVAVRPSGTSAFTELTPRQPLTPVPYAITAENLDGPLPAGQLTGTLPAASLSGTYPNTLNLSSPNNTLCGNGACLTGVNASTLNGINAANFWQLNGNAGTTPGVNFLGTTDSQPLELVSSGQRGLELEYTSWGLSPPPFGPANFAQQSVNVIGGYWGNIMPATVIGGTIAGGGTATYAKYVLPPATPGWFPYPNTVNANFGSVGGGYANTAGYAATVPGGYYNLATGAGSFAAGRYAQTTNDGSFFWSDGSQYLSGSGSNRFEALASGGVYFYTGAAGTGLSLTPTGQVGINTATPSQATLDVNLPIALVEGAGGEKAIIGGNGLSHDVLIGSLNPAMTSVRVFNQATSTYMSLSCASLTITGGADLAEPFQMPDDTPEGAVMVIDEEHPGQLKLSDGAYDTRVAGIVSGANGVKPGLSLQQHGVLESGKNVALSGRVYVLAETSGGPIKPGDLLTTSNTPGYAMKVVDHARAQGAILGKAMTGLSHGRGMVLILVTLQ